MGAGRGAHYQLLRAGCGSPLLGRQAASPRARGGGPKPTQWYPCATSHVLLLTGLPCGCNRSFPTLSVSHHQVTSRAGQPLQPLNCWPKKRKRGRAHGAVQRRAPGAPFTVCSTSLQACCQRTRGRVRLPVTAWQSSPIPRSPLPHYARLPGASRTQLARRATSQVVAATAG